MPLLSTVAAGLAALVVAAVPPSPTPPVTPAPTPSSSSSPSPSPVPEPIPTPHPTPAPTIHAPVVKGPAPRHPVHPLTSTRAAKPSPSATPKPRRPVPAAAAGQPKLSIAIDDGRLDGTVGSSGTYQVVVSNYGLRETALTLRVTAPDTVTIKESTVEWTVRVPPAGHASVSFDGKLGAPRTSRWVALTACAFEPGNQAPLACDTDVDAVVARSEIGGWIVVGVTWTLVAAFLAWYWRRRARPAIRAASAAA